MATFVAMWHLVGSCFHLWKKLHTPTLQELWGCLGLLEVFFKMVPHYCCNYVFLQVQCTVIFKGGHANINVGFWQETAAFKWDISSWNQKMAESAGKSHWETAGDKQGKLWEEFGCDLGFTWFSMGVPTCWSDTLLKRPLQCFNDIGFHARRFPGRSCNEWQPHCAA